MSRLGVLSLSSLLAVTGTLWYLQIRNAGDDAGRAGPAQQAWFGSAVSPRVSAACGGTVCEGGVVAASFAGGAALATASLLLLGAVRARGGEGARARTGVPPDECEDLLAQHANDLITLHDENGTIHYASSSTRRLTGYSPLELLGRRTREFVHDQDWPMLLAVLRAVISGSSVPPTLCRVRVKEGSWIWLEAEFRRHFDKAGRLHIVSVARGAGHRGSGRNGPGTTDLVHRTLATDSYDMVTLHAADGTVVQASPSTQRITGYTTDELAGRRLSDFWHPEDIRHAKANGTAGFGGFLPRATVRLRRRDGEHRWLDYRAQPAEGSPGAYMVAWRDVTESVAIRAALEESEKRCRHLAHHDVLTGLPNRDGFLARLREALRQAEREGTSMSLCLIDADNFGVVNDLRGHGAGDEVLVALATRLRTHAQGIAALARLGSDEFGVLVGYDDRGALEELAQRIAGSFAQPVPLRDGLAYLTSSLGIARYPQDALTAESLLAAADAALRAAKADGKNTSRFYDAEIGRNVAREASSLQELRAAYERGEFMLHYQLKVMLASWEVTGYEALLRWNSPDGIRAAGSLVAAAERSGFMGTLGEWVVREAARQSLAWRREGLAVPIAVNISARQLHEPSFLALMRELALADPQLPGALQLELTESALALDVDHARETLTQLAAMGFALHVDDFGTGYSSLSQLSRMPVHALKIDRSLVRDVPASAQSCEIARAVVALGRALDLKVIAEGVETAAQVKFLRSCGCDEAQGYLFGRPASAAEVAPMWRGRAAE